MEWTIEVVAVPVTDVGRARDFYADGLGFHVDFDEELATGRQVQLTPPGSGCSIVLGRAAFDWPGAPVTPPAMAPGTLHGLRLVVRDIRAARDELVARGVEATEVLCWDVPAGGVRPARDDDDLHNVGFVLFADPDGNSWALQQISTRR